MLTGSVESLQRKQPLSQLMVPSQMCKFPMPLALTQPSYHHRCWLLKFASITVRMVLFLFGPEDTTSTFSKKQFEMSTRQTTEHFSTWHQSISNELGPREVDGVSGCCWWMAFALHSRVLGCTYGCSDELYVGWQRFNNGGFSNSYL